MLVRLVAVSGPTSPPSHQLVLTELSHWTAGWLDLRGGIVRGGGGGLGGEKLIIGVT